LPVHDEVIVEELGAGREPGQVGAGVRLAHADAPDGVAADRARRHRLLPGVAELQQAGRDDRVTGEVARPRDATVRERLEVDERLHRCAVPAAELGRVARDHPTVIEERRLPVLHPLRDQVVVVADITREIETARGLGRRVRIEEFHEVGPKRLVFRPPSELHPVSRRIVQRSNLTRASGKVADPVRAWPAAWTPR
jgi:hypothetical protein